MVSYLGPDNMELAPTEEPRVSFVITGNNMPLALRQLGKIEPDDRIQVTRDNHPDLWGLVREVYDTDGEGTVLWNAEGADEAEAYTVDLYVLLCTGRKVRVLPR